MTAFHQQWRLDFAMRAAGLLLCGLAGLAIARLGAMPLRPRAVSAAAYLLATIAFLGASAGSAMALLGRHLFDEVAVSQRWRHRRPVRPPVAGLVPVTAAPDADGSGTDGSGAGGGRQSLGARGHA